MQDKDLYWLSGILEGEGSFIKGPPSKPNLPLIVIEMTDEDIIQRVADLFGNKVNLIKSRKENWKQTYTVRVCGSKAVELMNILKPLMGRRRQQQISVALESYNPKENSIIPKSDYQSIVDRFDSGESAKDLAKEYGVTHWSIYRLRERVKG